MLKLFNKFIKKHAKRAIALQKEILNENEDTLKYVSEKTLI